ncbi:HEPN domain-containing protein [Nocardioides dilutus]
MRGFILLVHAEVETYVEDMVGSVLDAAKNRWVNRQALGRCVTTLMMYNDKQLIPPPSLGKQNPNETLDATIKSVIKKHGDYVTKDNHGVKQKNLLRLLLPIGVTDNDLDPIWLGDMDTFGSLRGVVAHNSARRVQTPPDPGISLKTVNDVLAGLQQLEPLLVSLRRK